MIDDVVYMKTICLYHNRRSGMLEVYGRNDSSWDELWSSLPIPQKDVFARRCYYEAFAAPLEEAQSECAVLKDERGIIMHPYFRCPLTRYDWLNAPSDKFDLSSAYGYGGIYGNVECTELVNDFFVLFDIYCKNTGVVAELIRINPIVEMHPVMRQKYSLKKANSQVVVELQRSDEEIFRSYLHNNRKNVNKALRSGVSIVREGIDGNRFGDFLEIYEGTMKRRCAKESFVFSKGLYQRLQDGLKEKIQLFYSIIDEISVSAEVVLCSESAVYSFLGGTKEEYYENRPNNLLKHEIVKWARGQGFKRYLLGGGPDGNDGIFEYKRSFAPNGVIDFYIASHIYDQELYNHLIEKCMSHPPQSSDVASAYPLRWRYAQKELI